MDRSDDLVGNVVILYEDEKQVLREQIENLSERISESDAKLFTATRLNDVEAVRLALADLDLFSILRDRATDRLGEIVIREFNAVVETKFPNGFWLTEAGVREFLGLSKKD